MQTTIMHMLVNMTWKLGGCNNFAVNYSGVFCG